MVPAFVILIKHCCVAIRSSANLCWCFSLQCIAPTQLKKNIDRITTYIIVILKHNVKVQTVPKFFNNENEVFLISEKEKTNIRIIIFLNHLLFNPHSFFFWCSNPGSFCFKHFIAKVFGISKFKYSSAYLEPVKCITVFLRQIKTRFKIHCWKHIINTQF